MAWDADFDAKIAALTPDEINAAMKRYLDPQKMSIVKAGDFARVADSTPGPEKKN